MRPHDVIEDPGALLLAVGTTSGHLVVYDLANSSLFRRIYIHGAGVHGMCWVGDRQVREKIKTK